MGRFPILFYDWKAWQSESPTRPTVDSFSLVIAEVNDMTARRRWAGPVLVLVFVVLAHNAFAQSSPVTSQDGNYQVSTRKFLRTVPVTEMQQRHLRLPLIAHRECR